MVTRKLLPRSFFSREEKERIVAAVREAESKTSGEIRVFLERRVKGDLMAHAKKIFKKLGMTKTQKKNGILITFSLSDRSFALLGDQGIHQWVGENFWREIASSMQSFFERDEFAAGLEEGIRRMGEVLAKYFPRETKDVNELKDSIAEGK